MNTMDQEPPEGTVPELEVDGGVAVAIDLSDRPPRDMLKDVLASSEVVYWAEMPTSETGGHPHKMLATYAGGLQAVVKWAENRGTMEAGLHAVRAEVGTYEVARLMGFDDLVPATVFRDDLESPISGTTGPASVQLWLSDVEEATREGISDEQSWAAATLDVVTFQTDRAYNWTAGPANTGGGRHLWLIDNGRAFENPEQQRFWSDFARRLANRSLPPGVVAAIVRLLDALAKGADDRLRACLSARQIALLKQRASVLLDERRLILPR